MLMNLMVFQCKLTTQQIINGKNNKIFIALEMSSNAVLFMYNLIYATTAYLQLAHYLHDLFTQFI